MQASLALEAELNRERAGALGLTGQRLEGYLATCAELRDQLATSHPDARPALLEEYRKARAHAAECRWELIVQREAVGMRRHDDLDRWYPMPPAITE